VFDISYTWAALYTLGKLNEFSLKQRLYSDVYERLGSNLKVQ
jgi:hypothetical protein